MLTAVTFREGGGAGFVDSQIQDVRLDEVVTGSEASMELSDRGNFKEAGLIAVEELFQHIDPSRDPQISDAELRFV